MTKQQLPPLELAALKALLLILTEDEILAMSIQCLCLGRSQGVGVQTRRTHFRQPFPRPCQVAASPAAFSRVPAPAFGGAASAPQNERAQRQLRQRLDLIL